MASCFLDQDLETRLPKIDISILNLKYGDGLQREKLAFARRSRIYQRGHWASPGGLKKVDTSEYRAGKPGKVDGAVEAVKAIKAVEAGEDVKLVEGVECKSC